MPTTVARLSSNGVYFTNTYFDEVTYNVNKVSLSAIYSGGFDEVSINGGGVAKRETYDGNLLLSGYFDEITGISSGTFIGSTASTVIPTLNGSVSVSAASPFSFGSSYYITTPVSVPPYNNISVAGSTGFAFGTGDFTIEWFQYQVDSNSFPRIWWYGTSPSLGFDLEGPFGVLFWYGASSYFSFGSVAGLGSYKNKWTHFALVRISNSLKLYVNGVQIGSAQNFPTNITDSTSTLAIGGKPGGLVTEQFGGGITSFRIVKGVGVYTGNFTKPTSPLGQTQSANPYGGINTQAISAGQCSLLLNP